MTFQPQIAKRTREHLRNRPRTLTVEKIAEDTGLTVAWINDFSSSPERDHGVSKVETLYFYLKGEKLLNDDDSK